MRRYIRFLPVGVPQEAAHSACSSTLRSDKPPARTAPCSANARCSWPFVSSSNHELLTLTEGRVRKARPFFIHDDHPETATNHTLIPSILLAHDFRKPANG